MKTESENKISAFQYSVSTQVYAPVDSADNQAKNEFYECLTDVLRDIESYHDIIIVGDLNARIKSQKGSQRVERYAEDGERLTELCSQYQLKLANIFFAHKDIHRWERPALQQKSVIDYIIVKQTTTFKVYDSRVKRRANCGTDHQLLVAKIVYPFTTKKIVRRHQDLKRTIQQK
ncbi:hypothetical protein ILUMI_26524 [Ignelater luminosus]|uniref:Endonuclease/exonuclease/phosphatase domain-containing protein n=1 Tax=Ignelater luminosus TaxID=2038154 RepID=A0A8K0FYK7_IGNLU|nr:hypothetical protein ILUMI_26524 [Ignelater luminosus]